MNTEKIRRDHKITIAMTQDQARRAFAAAASREMNISELCREAITQKLDELGYGRLPADARPAA
jgi:hypothetical protein